MNPIFKRKTPEKFQFPIEVKPNFLRGYPDCQMWTFEIEEERCSLYDEAGMQVFSDQLIFCSSLSPLWLGKYGSLSQFFLIWNLSLQMEQQETLLRIYFKWFQKKTNFTIWSRSAKKPLVPTPGAQKNVVLGYWDDAKIRMKNVDHSIFDQQ